MRLPPFKLADYFAHWRGRAPHSLCSSFAEPWSLSDVLGLADPETLSLWENLELSYADPRGHLFLRHEIAQLYADVRSSQVLTFAGAEEGIFCTMHALVSPGDHVVVLTPCYQSLAAVPRALGADVSAVPLDEDGGWSLDLDKLKAALRPDTRLIVLNFPHNPTGLLLARAQLDEIVALARARDAWLFSDEVFRLLHYADRPPLPPVADLYERGISLDVMSKSLGLGGVRVGWLAARDEAAARRAGAVKSYTSMCNGAPDEILALIALRARDVLLERNVAILRDNLGLLDAFFARHRALFEWPRPQAGCLAFPRLLADERVEEFATRLAHEEGVLIAPGRLFDDRGNHFRIGLGRRNLPAVLERFERFCRRQASP